MNAIFYEMFKVTCFLVTVYASIFIVLHYHIIIIIQVSWDGIDRDFMSYKCQCSSLHLLDNHNVDHKKYDTFFYCLKSYLGAI